MISKTKRSIKWVKNTKNKLGYAGIHLIAEFWNGKNIEDPEIIRKILIKAARKGGNIPLETVVHKFSPRGITGVILLAESHIALHLWPEYDYLAIDIFTCGEKATPYKALDYLKEEFQPKRVETKELKRGERFLWKDF